MKTCPNCGSVLADNEPYCENCGYDPDFDGGGWADELIDFFGEYLN